MPASKTKCPIKTTVARAWSQTEREIKICGLLIPFAGYLIAGQKKTPPPMGKVLHCPCGQVWKLYLSPIIFTCFDGQGGTKDKFWRPQTLIPVQDYPSYFQ